jgi:hypothetical protein
MGASMVPSTDNSIQPESQPPVGPGGLQDQPGETPVPDIAAHVEADTGSGVNAQHQTHSNPETDLDSIPSVIPVPPTDIRSTDHATGQMSHTDQAGPSMDHLPSVIPVNDLAPAPKRGFWQQIMRILRFIGSVCQWTFGFATLFVGLAVLASIPILNLFSLGYLLEVSGRIAKTGRVRAGFVGVRKAAAVGGIFMMTVLWTLPLFFVAEMRTAARIIDPTSTATRLLYVGLIVLTGLIAGHLIWAYIRGGKIRHFIWPAPVRLIKWLFSANKYATMRQHLWDFTVSLRLPYYFWLGTRGFVGTVAWLIIPVTLLVIAAYLPPAPGAALTVPTMLVIATIALYLPFLQAHFAVENRMRAMFEVNAVRKLFVRAPIAFWFSLMIALLLALPLYLVKAELLPREAAWLPSLIFVAFIVPARFLTGWAVGRAHHHTQPRHFTIRWLFRFAALPVVLFYVLILYLTQYLSWYGAYSALDQHAFLMPAPLFGL